MSGNLSRSMRENYGTHGVDEYYKIVGSSYRNPHFPGIKQSINILMNKWWQNETARAESKDSGILICDLAAGSGEVTIALQEWWETCRNRVTPTLNTTPNLTAGASQPAPTPTPRPVVARPAVGRPAASTSTLLAPFPVISLTDPAPRIVAVDPYTADAYLQRTGLPCIALSFQDVAQDGLPEPPLPSDPPKISKLDDDDSIPEPKVLEPASDTQSTPTREQYDLVICSFALHLVTSPGALFALLSTLSYGAKWLVVLEPHKKPEIKDGWGWTLWDVARWKEAEVGPGKEGDFVKERVHTRVYKSTNS
ncbi:hypothetical protein FRC12_015980 [Ceratobasidium sp. 428]|nr:hypothetical protein FRC12_015980 [Ceratobasidium sp. 428]